MKLLLDEMYPRRLAEWLRRDGHDVVAVVELANLIGATDLEVAHHAREDQRVIVTENIADFASFDRGEHVGLLLVNDNRWPRTANRLPRLADALSAWLATSPTANAPTAEADGLVEWL